MAVTVTLGTLTFGTTDIDGDRFILSEIPDGWAGPGVDLHTVDRPLSAGAVVARARKTARALVLIGMGTGNVTDGPDVIWRLTRKLEAATDFVTADGTLTVDDPDGTYTLTVRLADQNRVRRAGPYAITFEISLLAPDPTKTLVP